MSSPHPDLSSVLRTLSAFANPTSSNPPSAISAAVPQQQQQQQQQQVQARNHERPSTQPQLKSATPLSQSSTSTKTSLKATDPTSITTWPSALKHIMHLVSQNQEFGARVQHLIKSQHDHERQWWKGREVMVAKQKTREEKKRQLEAVLKSVGVPTSTPPSNSSNSKEVVISTEQENAAELKAYDSKVYQASIDMSRAMETELRRLGVPFFCINHSLLAGDSRSAPATMSPSESNSMVSNDDLGALKKRVLDLLVDLCG